jgi:phage tail sheath gpL-like
MIQFDNIRGSIRKPGFYFEFNSRLASSGLPGNPQKTLIIAQRLAAGSAAALVPTLVFSEADAAGYFGTGSMAHLMVRAALKANPYLDLTVCALDDNVSGAAATGTVTLAGTATSAGVIRLWIGSRMIEISVASAAAAATIATALNAEIAKYGDLPVTATVLAGVVTLTARHKGTVGNQVSLVAEVTASGVTATVVTLASGTTDPTLQNALDKVYTQAFDVIITPYNDSTNLQTLKTHLDAVAGPLEQRGGVGVAGFTGTVANAVTLAAAVNSGMITIAQLRGTKSPAFEIAAAYGGVISGQEDPARPLNTLALTPLSAPDITQRFSRTEQESLLANGITPLEVGPGEVVQIVRAITTYTVNAASIPDIAWLDLTTIRTMFYCRKAFRGRIALRFPREKISAKTPDKVRSELLDVAKKLEALEILTDIDLHKSGFIVEKDITAVGRLNAIIPTPVVPGLHVFAGRMDLIL